MSSKNDWKEFATMTDFISAKAMVFLAIGLALITQTIAQVIAPSALYLIELLIRINVLSNSHFKTVHKSLYDSLSNHCGALPVGEVRDTLKRSQRFTHSIFSHCIMCHTWY